MTGLVRVVKQSVMSLGGVAALELFLKERNEKARGFQLNHCRCLIEVRHSHAINGFYY